MATNAERITTLEEYRTTTEKHIATANREMGEIVGELKGIKDSIGTLKWVMGGTALVVLAQFILGVLK